MKKLIVTFASILTLMSVQAQNNFFKTYSNLGVDQFGFELSEPGRCVRQLSDNDYLLFGISGDYFMINKLDINGQIVYSKTYDYPGHSVHGEQFIEASNGDILIVGSSYNLTSFVTNTLAIRIDVNGNVLWSKQYDAGIAFSVAETSSGNFAIAGQNMMLFVIDGTGAIVSSYGKRDFFGVYNGLDDIEPTSDGGLIMTGQPSGPIGSYDAALIKTDENGNMQWQKFYGGTDYDWGGAGVLQTPDGGYLVSGSTRSFGVDPGVTTDFYLIKTDGNGNLQWSKTYGTSNDDMARGVVIASDGGYVIAGYTGDFNGFDAMIIKTNAQGDFEWARTYDHTDMDGASFIDLTNDSGFVFTGGGSNSFPWPTDNYIIKTDSTGIIPGANCHGTPQITEGTPATQEVVQTYFGDSPIVGIDITVLGVDIVPDTVTVCQSPSVIESWNCDANHNCYDPGDGTGTYSTIGDCISECQDLGINVIDLNQIQMYPNPTNGILNISGKYNSLLMYNVAGELVLESEFVESIDLSRFSYGMYTFNVITDQEVFVHKIIIE
jgi:hypothetical protein